MLHADGDLPLHLACYNGMAPPHIIRALIDAYPDSVRKENKLGRDPLELAARNYRIDHPYRSEVLALLRWHRPGNSSPTSPNANEALPGIFSNHPPEQMYSASPLCVVCMEKASTVAMLPCGHICLCMSCSLSPEFCVGKCPVDRCEVQGLYQLQGEEVKIHESMCGECYDYDAGAPQRETVC